MLSKEEKEKLINTLPFPLAYLYQDLLVENEEDRLRGRDGEISFWKLMDNYRLLLRMVGIFSLGSYLQDFNLFNQPEINREVSNLLKQPTSENWFSAICSLVRHFSQFPKESVKIPQWNDLSSYTVALREPPPDGFPLSLNPRKSYNWIELMGFFVQLENVFLRGVYRLRLPSREHLQFYLYLLEEAFLQCRLFQEHEIYVLVGRDARKTRGFLCQSTRSKAVGIRGITSSTWQALKGRPFLCPIGQKQYISLFPFLVPLLQRYGEKTAFLDLLLYEHTCQDTMTFYGYRSLKLSDHQQCAQHAFTLMQKEIRRLENSLKKKESKEKEFLLEELSAYHGRHFVGRREVYGSLFRTVEEMERGYLFVRSRTGFGKTAFFSNLYGAVARNDFASLGISGISTPPYFAFHFCMPLQRWNDPIFIIQRLYEQILKQVEGKSAEESLSFIQKLPSNLEPLQKHFHHFLNQLSEEKLKTQPRKLVVAIDGIDALTSEVKGSRSLLYLLPPVLPKNVFFLLSWRISEERKILSENYLKDDIPFHAIHAEGTPVLELQGSPLGRLSLQDISAWCNLVYDREEEENEWLCQEISKKSEGDPLYLSFLADDLESGQVSWGSPLSWPQGRLGFMQKRWEEVPSERNFLAYRLLGLLGVLRENGDDYLFSGALGEASGVIERIRWKLNPLLRYQGKVYSFACFALQKYIMEQFRPQDQEEFHKTMVQYYCKAQEKNHYKCLTNEATEHLSYHYYHANESAWLNAMVYDEHFKEEKLKRFKGYSFYLDDISYALLSSFEERRYDQTLGLGYRYYQIVAESLQSVAHAFRSASHGEYGLAMERIRTIQDEHDLFKGLLIVLWYALENEHYSEASAVLDEIGHIPDEHVSFVTLEMEPLIIFTIRKLQESGISRIDGLIGKHGLKGHEAVEYLVSLHKRLDFNMSQLRHILEKLVKSAAEISESSLTQKAIREIVALWIVPESMSPMPHIWQEMIAMVRKIGDLKTRIEALKNLANATVCLAKKEYLDDSRNEMEALSSFLEEYPEIFIKAQYASLSIIHDEWEKAGKSLEQVFQKAPSLPYVSFSELFQYILTEIIGGWKKKPEYQSEWWARLKEILSGVKGEKERSFLQEKMVVSLFKRNELPASFKLLKQTQCFDTHSRMETLKSLSSALRDSNDPAFLAYWEMLLEQIPFVSGYQHRFDLLCEIAEGLFSLKIPADDIIWNRYLSACDLLKDTGHEQEKNQILSKLAVGFAQRGFLTKAQNLVHKLFDPLLRAEPSAEIAIKLIEQGELEGALEMTSEIVVLQQQLKVFYAMSCKIEEGEAGRNAWKKLTAALRMALEEYSLEESNSYFLNIVQKLSRDLPIQEAVPIWDDIFASIPCFKSDLAQQSALCTLCSILSQTHSFEKTVSFWPPLYALAEKLTSFYPKAKVYTTIARSLTHLGSLGEAETFLKNALTISLKITDPKQTIGIMAEIASAHRELGQENECREIFEMILRHCGIAYGKKLKDWNANQFVITLSELGLNDFSRNLAERTLLATLESGDEVPPPESLLHMAHVCIEAERYDWARFLFFRLLPILVRDYGNLAGDVPLYIKIVELLEKMAGQEFFHDLWERTEEMVLNLPKASMQERCLEMLASSLSRHGNYEEHLALWKKLAADASYVGEKLESLRSSLRIAKHMILRSSWDVVSKNLSESLSGRDVFEAIDQIGSDYDKVNTTEMLAEVLVSSPVFEKKAWENLVHLPREWKRSECYGLSLIQFAKILIRGKSENRFEQSRQILEQVMKPSQKQEGYLLVAQEYASLGEKEACFQMLEMLLREDGPGGAQRLLPGIAGCYIRMNEYDKALSLMGKIVSPLEQVKLRMQIVKQSTKEGDGARANQVLDQAIRLAALIPPQQGDQAKMFGLCSVYLYLLQGVGPCFPILSKLFDSWSYITNQSYKKETILEIVQSLEGVISSPSEFTALLFEKLVEKSSRIEGEAYRFWAMQKVAEAMLRMGDFAFCFEVMGKVPCESEVKLNLLSAYARESIERNRIEEALALLDVLISPKEKSVFVKQVAETLEKKDDLEHLFQFYLKVPADFGLLCHVSTRILAVALRTRGKDCFSNWAMQISSIWGFHRSRAMGSPVE